MPQAPSFMKKRWRNDYLDMRDRAREHAEDFLNGFWQPLREWLNPFRIIVGVGVLGIAGLMILSNLVTSWFGEDSPTSPPPELRASPPSQPDQEETETPADEEGTEDEKPLPPWKRDREKIKKVGIHFVQEYTTYEDWNLKERAKRIKPFTTEKFYEREKTAAKNVPKNIPSFSKFERVKDVDVDIERVNDMENGAYLVQWEGTVTSISEGEDRKNQRLVEEIQLTMVLRDKEWKVAEVVYL